jgi:fibronectin type 3 domain-containing protein
LNIYHNNIISNSIQNIHDSNNYWSYNMEGNYWSDYTGVDNGAGGRTAGDGIGDTWLPHRNDNYPFMSSFGWDRPATPILSGPGNLVTESTFVLGWTSGPRTNGFILERDTSPIFSTAVELYNGTGKSIILNNHINGTFYFRVKAFNDNYESTWSNILTITVDWAPSKPTGLAVKDIDGKILTLKWNLNPEPDIEGYHIMVNNSDSGAADPFVILETVNETTSEITFSNLAEKITYDFTIIAFDIVPTDSAPSDVLPVTIPDLPPKPPTGLAVKSVGTNSITLSWNANVAPDLAGYNLYRSETESGTFRKVNSDWLAVIEYTDSGLDEATTYYYKLTAVDLENHESTFSESVNGTTILSEYPPEVINPIDDFSITEDSTDDSTINLMITFNDINGDSMFFSCTGQKNIKVTIHQDDGSVVIEPAENWCGTETITFFAKDASGEDSESVTITVLPVNDAPTSASIIEPRDRIKVREDEAIDFSGTFTDVDIPFGDEHNITWTSNITGKFAWGLSLENVKLPVGTHLITFEVTDQAQMSVSDTIELTVVKLILPLDPTGTDTESEEKDDTGLGTIFIDLVLVVAVLLIAFVAMIIIRRRRESDDEIEDMPEEELEDQGEDLEAEPQSQQLAPPLPLASAEKPQPVSPQPVQQPQLPADRTVSEVEQGQLPTNVQERVQEEVKEEVHAEVEEPTAEPQVVQPFEQPPVHQYPVQQPPIQQYPAQQPPIQQYPVQQPIMTPYGQLPPQQYYPAEGEELPPCPKCGANMTFVPEFYKYYCVECNK